jgi:hypothetical protein
MPLAVVSQCSMRAADLLQSACGVGIRYRRRGRSTPIPCIHYRTSTAHGSLDDPPSS